MSDDLVVNNPEALQVAKLLGARQAILLRRVQIQRRFRDTAIYMVGHTDDGAMGLVINQLVEDMSFADILEELGLTEADRTIRLFKELGPGYFELSQLTRISPQEFRSIAANVQGQSIHLNGEVIALIEANTEKVAAAVTELRQTAKSEPTSSTGARGARLAGLERRCQRLATEFYQLRRDGEKPKDLAAIAFRMMMMLDALSLELSER